MYALLHIASRSYMHVHACFDFFVAMFWSCRMHALQQEMELNCTFDLDLYAVCSLFAAQAQGTCTERQKKTTGQSFLPLQWLQRRSCCIALHGSLLEICDLHV